MSEGINRHKSTRWLQNGTTSYGDEWGDEGESEGEFSNKSLKEVQDEHPLPPIHQTAVVEEEKEISKDSKVLSGIDEATRKELQGTETQSKRTSRFFVTNPDPSDSESDTEEPATTEGHWESSTPSNPLESQRDEIFEQNDEPEVESTGIEELAVEAQNLDLEGDSFEDIEPTPPLKVHSRASSRNASVNLDENNDDKLASDKKEKLKSKDYSNIEFVMDDYLSKRDSQFYDDSVPTEKVGEMEKLQEENEDGIEERDIPINTNEAADNTTQDRTETEDTTSDRGMNDSNEIYRYEQESESKENLSDTLDHDHSLASRGVPEGTSTHDLSVTPNDYSLSKSLSSGSLSTGSWSVRSSAQFVNAPSSTRDSFIGKLRNDMRPASDTASEQDVEEADGPYSDDNEGEMEGKESAYMDSSSEDDESIKFQPGQSINFGHWRPNTSNFRNAFIKDTYNDDNDSVAPSVNEEDEDYDDSYSVTTDQNSLAFQGEEEHFFTKPLDEGAGMGSDSSNKEVYGGTTGADLREGSIAEVDNSRSVDDDLDSNATETEQIEDDDDEGTDVDEGAADELNDLSTSTDGTGVSGTMIASKKQRYSSLLSGTSTDASTPRQTSVSSSIDQTASRVLSDSSAAKDLRTASQNSNASSQQTTLRTKGSSTKQFIPFDFRQIQKLTNPENRITELRKMSDEESKVNTGLQEWLTSELTKVSVDQDSYDSLGPITLNAYKQATTTTHLHGHSVADMISRKHSLNFGGVVGHGRLRLKNKVGDHGGNLAKGIFNRGKKIMRNNSNGNTA